ncbi:hypothetical protein ALC57_16344, partial [Trachymyrmex cornetzi]
VIPITVLNDFVSLNTYQIPYKSQRCVANRRPERVRNERTDARGGETMRYCRNGQIDSPTQPHRATVATRLKFAAGRLNLPALQIALLSNSRSAFGGARRERSNVT